MVIKFDKIMKKKKKVRGIQKEYTRIKLTELKNKQAFRLVTFFLTCLWMFHHDSNQIMLRIISHLARSGFSLVHSVFNS